MKQFLLAALFLAASSAAPLNAQPSKPKPAAVQPAVSTGKGWAAADRKTAAELLIMNIEIIIPAGQWEKLSEKQREQFSSCATGKFEARYTFEEFIGLEMGERVQFLHKAMEGCNEEQKLGLEWMRM